jgi:hypothetical protein
LMSPLRNRAVLRMRRSMSKQVARSMIREIEEYRSSQKI